MSSEALQKAFQLLAGRRMVALTGAGLSTDSGIPDYRGPNAKPRTPIQHRDFVTQPAVRARYWARAVVGWPRIAQARPNAGHLALATLEERGSVSAVITQNVDRLHSEAGSRAVVELHGALAQVRCLACDALEPRQALQERLLAQNPWLAESSALAAPDGDAELSEELIARFLVVGCQHCEGALKPDVVFFGGSVPAPLVEKAYAMLEAAEVLLVLGSSLTVFSGYRFALKARDQGKPIVIINQGETRADPLATVKVDAPLGPSLTALAARR